MHLAVKRLLAFLIDYALVVMYAILLLGVTMLVLQGNAPKTPSPIQGQLIGFATLTLPVFLYFFLSEQGKHKGTLGKRWLKIYVVTTSSDSNFKPVFLRNLLKFLPWELAHTGVHWMVYYTELGTTPPLWVWVVLIVPQVVVVSYSISLLMYKGVGSFYDQLAGTSVSAQRLFKR